MFDDEEIGDFAADPLHSLLMLFTDTTPGGSNNVLLQENGSAILQEDGSFILI